jgi:hypothetical protein
MDELKKEEEEEEEKGDDAPGNPVLIAVHTHIHSLDDTV